MAHMRILVRPLLTLLLSVAIITHCSKSYDSVNDGSKDSDVALQLLLGAPFLNGPVVDYSWRESPGRGRLLQSQLKWDLSLTETQLLLGTVLSITGNSLSDYPSLSPDYGISCYAITYNTIDVSGNLIVASGAIWMPHKSGPLRILSFDHGTSLDTLVDGFASPRNLGGIYASQGYYTAHPDFIGYGASENLDHPYLHADSLASATIDMVRAAQRFATYNGISLENKLFITGVSEGGMAALATLKEIETNSAPYGDLPAIAATAPISGPYDLRTTVDSYLNSSSVYTSRGQSGYIEFLLSSYNKVYGINQDLSHYLREPYASELAPDLYPRPDWDSVVSHLPYTASELLTSSFLSNYPGGSEATLAGYVADNDTYNKSSFCPQTSSVRFYASMGDTVVPYTNAQTAYDNFDPCFPTFPVDRSMEILPASAGDHGKSAILFVAHSLEWFAGY